MWEEIRELFPVRKHCTYLNNAGVVPPSLRVLDALGAYHRLHAEHGFMEVAIRFRDLGHRIKEILGRLLNCPATSIALTHNTSEGMNILAQGLSWSPGDTPIGSSSRDASLVVQAG